MPQPKGKSPLTPLQAGEESVALEIFFARFDYGYPPFAEKLWEEVDEQVLPADIRRELARNGFRAGIVGSQVPVELARLLTLTDVPQPQQQGTTVDLENEPTVKLRLLEIRSGRRGEIIASPVYDHLPLLMRKGKKSAAKPTTRPTAASCSQATRHVDGRVGLDLLPELHYGKTEQKWIPVDGVFHLVSSQRKKVFEHMQLHVDLSAGPDVGPDLSARPSRQPRPLLLHRTAGRRTAGPAAGDRATGPGRFRPLVLRNRFGRDQSGHRATDQRTGLRQSSFRRAAANSAAGRASPPVTGELLGGQ